MKLSCNVVMDLMPLYIDGVASDESAEMIEAHMKECPSCKKYFKNHATPAPQEIIYESKMDYSNIAKRIRTRRLWFYAGLLSYISVSICAVGVLWIRRKHVNLRGN